MGRQSERNRAAAVAANEPSRCHQCSSTVCRSCRRPYVGSGADGAFRSAQIDREEADTLHRDDPRIAALMASADRWEMQAERLGGSR